MEGNPLATLTGSVEFNALKSDGSSEVVNIRQLAVKDYPAYLLVIDDEPRAAEMLCGKPKDWADTLKPASLGALIEQGEELNLAFYPWVGRRVARAEKLMPGVTEKSVKAASASMSGSANGALAAAAPISV